MIVKNPTLNITLNKFEEVIGWSLNIYEHNISVIISFMYFQRKFGSIWVNLEVQISKLVKVKNGEKMEKLVI